MNTWWTLRHTCPQNWARRCHSSLSCIATQKIGKFWRGWGRSSQTLWHQHQRGCRVEAIYQKAWCRAVYQTSCTTTPWNPEYSWQWWCWCQPPRMHRCSKIRKCSLLCLHSSGICLLWFPAVCRINWRLSSHSLRTYWGGFDSFTLCWGYLICSPAQPSHIASCLGCYLCNCTGLLSMSHLCRHH